MKIGFDLDKIFVDTPPLVPDKIIERLYKQKTNGSLLYRIPSQPEQLLRRLTHVSFLRPPLKNNIQFLSLLYTQKHILYLISSRFGFLEDITYKLLTRYGLDKMFAAHYFNFQNKQPHLFKNEVLKKLALDLYIDDDLELLRYLAPQNPQTSFFYLNSKTMPQVILPNLYAVNKLEDILKNTSLVYDK